MVDRGGPRLGTVVGELTWGIRRSERRSERRVSSVPAGAVAAPPLSLPPPPWYK
jgi:hypothetical protein